MDRRSIYAINSNSPHTGTTRQSLIRARQEANLTQDQLTDRLGAADAFINKIENGKRNMGFFEFYTIVKAMGQDPIKLAREVWDGDD